MRYASVTGAGSREVFLDGEALFEVTHDDARPFRVYTAAGIAEDLGTEFVVRAYQADSAVRVIVASGRVALHPSASAGSTKAPAPAATLEPGDLGEVRGGAVAVQRGIDPSTYLAWTRGQITFDRMPLTQVLRELERWYDIHIELTEPRYGGVPVTASFQNQSVDEVLSLLAGMLDMRYARKALEHVHTLWGRPVHLETVIDDESTVLHFNGDEHGED